MTRIQRSLVIFAAVFAATLGVVALKQQSSCVQQGGSFTVGIPNVCIYPAGNPHARDTATAEAYCATYYAAEKQVAADQAAMRVSSTSVPLNLYNC